MSPINRVFGLSGSGLDVDKLVADMMKVQRMKQDRIKQNKQIAQWQEESYRDLNNSLRSLRDSAFTMKLQGTFLARKVTSSNEGIVQVTANSLAVTGSHTLQVTQLAANARLNSISAVEFDGSKTTLVEQLGLEAAGTVTFSVNGSQEITINTSEDSIDNLVSKINEATMADGTSAGVSASFDRVLSRMFISSTATGAQAEVNIAAGEGQEDQEGPELLAGLFSALKLGSLDPDTHLQANGRDAKIIYDGLHLNQSSNQFTISGVSYTLTGTSDTEVVNISLTDDTDAVFDTIKSFVELYNTTLEQINTKLGEVKNRDYLPLTDDQREELSEKQQEKWEDEARIGLLRNDNILSGVINDMRWTLSSFVEGADATCKSLADIGITTGAWFERGKLYINEDQLKEALATNPQGVMDLFTRISEVDSEKGLANRLYDNITARISQIIDKAGSNDSILGKRIADYDKQIALWDSKLQDMEQRYYKQYAALETALARMNQQSLSLMSLFGQENWG